MSIRVAPTDLPSHIVRRGGGFLLTSIMDSRPHVAHLGFEVAAAEGQVQLRGAVGRTSNANCRRRPSITILFPPIAESAETADSAGTIIDGVDVDRYSLIIDGEARPDGDSHVIIAVTGAVFHRPSPPMNQSGAPT